MSTLTAEIIGQARRAAALEARPADAPLPILARNTTPPWPKPLASAAYHWILGSIVQTIAPETEADPAALLVQMMIMFGNVIERTAYWRVRHDHHHLNLFAVLVGPTGTGRKGTSSAEANTLYTAIDELWFRACVTTGLSSGEGLIWSVRDAIEKVQPIKVKGRVVDYETVIEEHGIDDKRLLVLESEFARTLRVITRERNTLSAVIRQAWDGQDLRHDPDDSGAGDKTAYQHHRPDHAGRTSAVPRYH